MTDTITESQQRFNELVEIIKPLKLFTYEQLAERYQDLKKEAAPATTKDWLFQACARLVQIKYYTDNGVEMPKIVVENNDVFFNVPPPQQTEEKKRKKERKTVPNTENVVPAASSPVAASSTTSEVTAGEVEKKPLIAEAPKVGEEDSIVFFDMVFELAKKVVPPDDFNCHDKKHYATIKKNKRVAIVVKRRRKAATVAVWKGNDENSPLITINVGTSESAVEEAIKKLVAEHMSS